MDGFFRGGKRIKQELLIRNANYIIIPIYVICPLFWAKKYAFQYKLFFCVFAS